VIELVDLAGLRAPLWILEHKTVGSVLRVTVRRGAGRRASFAASRLGLTA